MSYIFHIVFYQPLYNGLIFLIGAIPWVDVGWIVILFTCIIKLILFPLSQKSTRTQLLMKEIQPEIDEIKKKSAGNKQDEAVKTMELYKKKGINPFSGLILIILQIPIIFALYFVFFKGGLPKVDVTQLYSFIHIPTIINMKFLGLIDIAKASTIIAVLAAASQFFQIKLAMPVLPKTDKKDGDPSFKDELARSMSIQMKYIMPVFVLIAAYNLPAVVSLYWTTSNLFAIGQEIYLRRLYKKK
jgi:YidC/Oxa1 family membrane protein insertase